MSGHSRWAQIKHQKAITDRKRGQLFSKLSKLISLAARKGTSSEINLELKNAIDKARSFNMPQENIERAIKKITDKTSGELEELLIHAIGPGGVALAIKAITDSRNRTIAEIKKILSDFESKLVPPGSISWMFHQSKEVSVEIQEKLDQLFHTLDDHDDVEDIDSNLP